LASEYLYFSDFIFNTITMIMITEMIAVILMIHSYFTVDKKLLWAN